MCGIAGLFAPQNFSNSKLKETLMKMGDTILHRGPDDFGLWTNDQNIGFIHRRLSILDLSEFGKQPMHSQGQRYVICYNGEIYNFEEIKRDLSRFDINYKGHSDTEILVNAIELLGLENTLKKIKGMFAFALFDKKEQTITIARDRTGQKPLYYGMSGKNFIFSSELKAFLKVEGFQKEIDQDVIALYFKYGYIPTPYSIFKNVNKLPPGSYITVSLKDLNERPKEALNEGLKYFWKVNSVFNEDYINDSFEQTSLKLEEIISNVISEQMKTDVPYGAFLSGGIDSSLVTALMQKQSKSPIKTFSIGFHEKEFNEAHHAKEVASHLKTNHTEFYVTPKDLQDVIPLIPKYYDEPFSDSSQIPTYLVSKLAKQHVTVCLSGDGGDEVFCGYNRYLWTDKIYNKSKRLPQSMRKLASKLDSILAPDQFDTLFKGLQYTLPKKFHFKNPGNKYQKILNLLPANSIEECYQSLISHWNGTDNLVLKSKPLIRNSEFLELPNLSSHIEKMIFLDLVNYMMDDILVKVDRASMANSLETRVPLIDQRVIEFSSKIPLNFKLNNNNQKYILKEILYKYVPKSLIERPKSGFSIPVGSWINNELNDWANSLLDPIKIKNQGILNNEKIQQKWTSHLSRKNDHTQDLWDVLMFQSWMEEYFN